MKVLKQIWSAFNRWRRRHWVGRVVILLAIFIPYVVFSAPLLPRLVGHAIDAILADSEPRMANAIYRSNKANAVRRLRKALVAKIDKDENGILSESERQRAAALGLDPDQLSMNPFQANIEQVVGAAQHAGIVPTSYTARAVRKEAWDAAQAETKDIMVPQRQEINAMMVWYRRPNYLTWGAWENGITRFLQVLEWRFFYTLGNPSHWIPFFVSVYLLSLVACLLLWGNRALAASLLSLLIVLPVVLARMLQVPAERFEASSIGFSWYEICRPAGYFLLILSAAICGARRGYSLRGKKGAKALSLLALGLVLVAWSVSPGFKVPITLYPDTVIWFEDPSLMGVYVSPQLRIGMAAMGGVAFTAGVVVLIASKIRRQKLVIPTA